MKGKWLADRMRTLRLIPLTAVLLVAACQSTGQTVSNKPAGSPSASSSSAASKAPVAHLGDTIVLKGQTSGDQLTVQLVKVVDPAQPANAFGSPDPGKRFVAVELKLTNTGTGAYSGSPEGGAKALDASGQAYDTVFDPTTAGQGFGGAATISPGSSQTGFLTFALPTGTTVAKVQFALSSGFGNVGEWLIP